MDSQPDVLRVADVGTATLEKLLQRFSLEFHIGAPDQEIRGSYWGEPEAGIIGNTVYARQDTPVHSVLHETCHLICASSERRASLETDAGSDDLEENAVCYLQIVLSDFVAGLGRDRLMRDMDAWGYSFRLGSSRAWFTQDAEDAVAWLTSHKLIDGRGAPCWKLRE